MDHKDIEPENNLDLMMDIPMEITVRLGKTSILVKDLMQLGEGSILELDKLSGEATDILANGKPVARGEVIVIDDSLGIRVTEMVK